MTAALSAWLPVALLGLLGPPAADWEDLDVLSGNGWYRAEIRRVAGFEEHPPERSRWRVSVTPTAGAGRDVLWTCHFPYDGTTTGYVLSDDGRSLARVHEGYQDYRAVMTLVRDGRELTAPLGGELGLPPGVVERTSTGKRWLAADGVPDGTFWLETDAGPEPMLELVCLGGERRFVSLADGRVWGAEEFDALFRVAVEPALPERYTELVQTPFVRSVHPPSVVRAGEPAPVVVQADHPTPGWRFEGFVLEQSGDEGRELTVTPRSRGPVGRAVPEVLEPFRPTAELVGLVPGHYRVRVVGRATPDPVPFELEVLPADVLVRVESSGGLTGALEVLTLLGRGELRARAEDGAESSAYASAEAISNARQLLGRLPRASRSHRDGTTSELVMHRLTYWFEDALVVAELDDTTLQAEERSLLALLAGLRR